MAKVILKIGYNKFYLPSDRGVMTVINTLSKAVMVEEDLSNYRSVHSPKVFIESDEPADISMIVLKPDDIVRKSEKTALPVTAGPDGSGRDITRRD